MKIPGIEKYGIYQDVLYKPYGDLFVGNSGYEESFDELMN